MQIPKLLFQPIVENAVVHGIAKKVAGGEVSMIWEETEGGVFVKISNPMPETLPAQGFGIGLDSLKKRCLFFFGSKSRVSVVNENGYFEVTVFLPRKTTT